MATTQAITPSRSPRTQRLPSGTRVLLRALLATLHDGTTITVPEGFETDLSSIPHITQSFIHSSRVDIAGVVHDYLYWCPQHTISRTRADAIWRELAGRGVRRATFLQRWLGWTALRLLGWRAHRHVSQARAAGHTRQCQPPAPPDHPAAPHPSEEDTVWSA